MGSFPSSILKVHFKAYPKGKLDSTVVIVLLSSLEQYIIGLEARPRIRIVVVKLISLMSIGSGYTPWRIFT